MKCTCLECDRHFHIRLDDLGQPIDDERCPFCGSGDIDLAEDFYLGDEEEDEDWTKKEFKRSVASCSENW